MKHKLVFIMGTTAILAYISGLLFEAAAFGEDSKLYRFANIGKFDSAWIPFFMDGQMSKIEKLKSIAGIEIFNPKQFIKYEELSRTSTVPSGAFGDEIVPTQVSNESSLQNVEDKCYFDSKESFSPSLHNSPEKKCP